MQVIAEEGNLPNVILSVSPDHCHCCHNTMKTVLLMHRTF